MMGNVLQRGIRPRPGEQGSAVDTHSAEPWTQSLRWKDVNKHPLPTCRILRLHDQAVLQLQDTEMPAMLCPSSGLCAPPRSFIPLSDYFLRHYKPHRLLLFASQI